MDGFVYVASGNSEYYKAAVRSAISLKDHWPEAKAALFTHEKLLVKSDEKHFDHVYTGIPIHKRAKMWGMARTPFDRTLYLDADTEIRSENIKKVFDNLKKSDIMFTKIVSKVSKDRYIDHENQLDYHGGVILYNSDPLTLQLMQDWYELYRVQETCNWGTSQFAGFNSRMRPWDQFTIWYLLNRDVKYSSIKHGFFPDNGHSFNYIHLFDDLSEYRDIEQIVYHYTIPGERLENAHHIKVESGASGDFN